jgi:CubicO group peptidase (beta-lactamase class C family)
MQDELFGPLGMTAAGFGAPGLATIVTEPRGHQDQESGRKSGFVDNPSALGPAGTVHVSLEDWAKFIRLHLNGRGGTIVLTDASMKRLHTPYPSSDDIKYGAGWGIDAAKQTLGHDGSNTWWYARAAVDLKNGYATIAAVNLGDSQLNANAASKACGDIVTWLRNRYIK